MQTELKLELVVRFAFFIGVCQKRVAAWFEENSKVMFEAHQHAQDRSRNIGWD